jgi:hypothetical protein
MRQELRPLVYNKAFTKFVYKATTWQFQPQWQTAMA